MTYDRMKAKKIKGEHCRFCGDDSVPLVKTKCCDQWICCDTSYVSFRGGGFCQDEHERYSACYFHYNEGHQEKLGETKNWENCKECNAFFEDAYGDTPPGMRNEAKF